MLEKRISVKRVFETSLEISKQKTYQDITAMTERIMSSILDYEAFCECEEASVPKRALAPQKVVGLFQRKIGEKLNNLKRGNSNLHMQGLHMSNHKGNNENVD